MIKNRDDTEIVNFVEIDEFFEEKNHVMELVDFNYEVDDLVEGCDTVKVDAIVTIKKLKENMVMLKTLVVKVMIFFFFLGDFFY